MENLRIEFSFLIQICGDHLAVLFYGQLAASAHNFFVVWNWRTGQQEVVSNSYLFCLPHH